MREKMERKFMQVGGEGREGERPGKGRQEGA